MTGGKPLFDWLRKRRRERVLRDSAIPDALWDEACATLPFLDRYAPLIADLARS